MNFLTNVSLYFCVCAVLAGCAKGPEDPASVLNQVTSDIKAGIEKHIEEQTRLGEGYFKFSSDGKDYLFKLVRVHTEYLAKLGPRSHFACVDLVDTKGDVYDVDFFLMGDPGVMTVTDTTLHKLNGIPFYAWKQNQQGVWKRIPIEGASQELLGVKTGRDEFEFNYQATLPVITSIARMWIPLPTTDEFQKVQMEIVSAPGKHRVLHEREHDNKILFFELGPEDSEKTVDIRYQVQRIEKAAYVSNDADLKKHLEEENLVPIDDNFRTIAIEIVEGKKGDLVRARALYDHVIERMSYIKHGPGWGRGDAVYACNVRTGNCTDYHAYFIALARAVGIPARFAIGAAIPSARNDGGIAGYHCWVEFHAEGKWWPVDISEADKYSSLSTYYFGHHPANRFEFSRGRDLVVEPGPVSGPINFLAYPVLEVGDELTKVPVTFSFNRTVSGT
jgi:transglutaminase-like putative cysteine protease